MLVKSIYPLLDATLYPARGQQHPLSVKMLSFTWMQPYTPHGDSNEFCAELAWKTMRCNLIPRTGTATPSPGCNLIPRTGDATLYPARGQQLHDPVVPIEAVEDATLYPARGQQPVRINGDTGQAVDATLYPARGQQQLRARGMVTMPRVDATLYPARGQQQYTPPFELVFLSRMQPYTPHGDSNMVQHGRPAGGKQMQPYTPHGDSNERIAEQKNKSVAMQPYTPHGDSNLQFLSGRFDIGQDAALYPSRGQ